MHIHVKVPKKKNVFHCKISVKRQLSIIQIPRRQHCCTFHIYIFNINQEVEQSFPKIFEHKDRLTHFEIVFT